MYHRHQKDTLVREAHGTSLGTSNRLFRHDMTCASPDDFTSTAAFRVGVSSQQGAKDFQGDILVMLPPLVVAA